MDKMQATKAAYLEGRIDADANGYISTPDGGLTFKAPERSKVYASVGRGSSAPTARATVTGNAKARWDSAVAAALPQCRGNKQRAVAMVAKAKPELRAQLVKEANAGNAPRAHRGQRPIARQQPGHQRPTPRARGATNGGGLTREQFTSQLETLMQRDGLSKMEAARQLSREMGLSQHRDEPGYFEQGRERYYN